MGKDPLTTRLDADTKQVVENYAEDRDIGQTEAARRLIRSGLAAEGYSAADGGSPLERLGSLKTVLFSTGLSVLAMLAFIGALVTSFTLPLVLVGTAFLFSAMLTILTAVLAQIALARPLKGLLGRGSEVSADD
jgi:hypothetical protein